MKTAAWWALGIVTGLLYLYGCVAGIAEGYR